jgi:hypothetical protein
MKPRFSWRAFSVTATVVIMLNVVTVMTGHAVAVLALIDFWGLPCLLPTIPHILSPRPLQPIVPTLALLAPAISACAWGCIAGRLFARAIPDGLCR